MKVIICSYNLIYMTAPSYILILTFIFFSSYVALNWTWNLKTYPIVKIFFRLKWRIFFTDKHFPATNIFCWKIIKKFFVQYFEIVLFYSYFSCRSKVCRLYIKCCVNSFSVKLLMTNFSPLFAKISKLSDKKFIFM